MVTSDQSTPVPATPRARTTILLVDDQRFVGLALARLLDGEHAFELHCCERGAEALATVDRVRPDVILQDLVMPDADGLALVRTYRQRAATSATPVIVLSGNDDEATRVRALEAGAADYLVKLPAKEAFIACLTRQLSDVPAAPAARVDAGHVNDSDAPLDADVLASYRDEGAADPNEAARTLVEIFLTDSRALAGRLRAAVAASDTAEIARVAHALKGCAMAVGARSLAALSARLESGQETGASVVARLEQEIQRVKDACGRALR
jgi:DNA-binding response OmpR family regulator